MIEVTLPVYFKIESEDKLKDLGLEDDIVMSERPVKMCHLRFNDYAILPYEDDNGVLLSELWIGVSDFYVAMKSDELLKLINESKYE